MQKCDGSGTIVYYDTCQERMRRTTCPTCGGLGCSSASDILTEAVSNGLVRAIPYLTIAALLAAMYLKSR